MGDTAIVVPAQAPAGDTDLCIVCQDAPRAVRFNDCGHGHLCALCTLTLISRNYTAVQPSRLVCPTCKADVVRIEEMDGGDAQPDFVRGACGGGSIESFIDAHCNSADAVLVARATDAKATWNRPIIQQPFQQSMERQHLVETDALAGCWINLCALPILVPCSFYSVRRDGEGLARGEDVLRFSGWGCCCCGCPIPVAGTYRRNNYHDELRFDKTGGMLATTVFVVKNRRHMLSDTGGRVYKLGCPPPFSNRPR